MPPLSRGSTMHPARPALSTLSLVLVPPFLVLHVLYHLAHAVLSFVGVARRLVRASSLGGGVLSSGSNARVEARLALWPTQATRKVPRHIALVLAPPPPRTLQLLLRLALRGIRLHVPPLDLELRDDEVRLRRTEALVEQVRDAARWCALVGCEELSVYDPQGLIQQALVDQEHWLLRWNFAQADTAATARPLLMPSPSYSSFSKEVQSVSGTSTPAFHTPMLESSISSFAEAKSTYSSNGDDEDTDSGFASGRSTPPTEVQTSLPSADSALFRAAAEEDRTQFALRIQLNAPFSVDMLDDEGVVSKRAASKFPSLQPSASSMVRGRSEGKTSVGGKSGEAFLKLHLLGPGDGHGAFVDATKVLVKRARQGDTRGVDVKAVDEVMTELNHPSEPDLLVLHGGPRRVCCLQGFPPWPVRLTEIYYEPRVSPRHPLSASTFETALELFGGSQQRFGK